MSEQLAFSRILAEADEQTRAALERHRDRVQAWFDELLPADKERLAEMMTAFEFDTCVASRPRPVIGVGLRVCRKENDHCSLPCRSGSASVRW